MSESTVCSACATQLAPGMKLCPSCKRLVHAERLQELAAAAKGATAAGDLAEAMAKWNDALPLLPGGSKQFTQVQERIDELQQRLASEQKPTARNKWLDKKTLAGVGVVALLLWKFKFLIVAIASKAKLLLLGLSKSSTLFTMLASAGLYWTVWGWQFAVGLVLSIYVHEMGHVAALRRHGYPASAPIFIPGLGAMIRLKQAFNDPKQDADVGLAGPVWGLGAALAAWAGFYLFDRPILAGIAQFGAWINLFNLLPVWQLDGGRAFAALSRQQRWLACLGLLAVYLITREGLLLLLIVVAAARAFARPSHDCADSPTLYRYVGLALLLSLLATIHVPVPER